MNRIKFLLSLIGVILMSSLLQVEAKKVNYLLNKPECTTKNMKRIELIVAKAITFGPNGRKLPENFDQLKLFCR